MKHIFHRLEYMFHQLKYVFHALEQNFHSAKVTIVVLFYNNFSVIFQKCYNIDVFVGTILAFRQRKKCVINKKVRKSASLPGFHTLRFYLFTAIATLFQAPIFL